MATPAAQFENPGHFYAQRVLSGDIRANDLIARACRRYLDDWDHAEEKGLVFREEFAVHALEWQQDLRFSKGAKSGQKFIQLPWQRFITWNLYGWYIRYVPDESDIDPPEWVRRFRTALILVQKKNGKTVWLAAQGLYLADGDGEDMAEVYSGATTRDQAKLVWTEACSMRRRHPHLKKRSIQNLSEIRFDHGGIFKPLAAKADSADGKNPNGVLLDELHLHPDRSLHDVLVHSMAREQPLAISISTAGNNTASFCYEQHDRGERILLGQEVDERHFVFICEPDRGDEWTDEEVWRKVNPSLGHTFTMDALRADFQEAQTTASARDKFRQYRVGFWVGAAESFLDKDEWDACKETFGLEDFRGQTCMAGIDLADTRDFNSLVITFKGEDEHLRSLAFFWCPEKTAQTRQRQDRIPYMAWHEMGLIDLIPGARTQTGPIAAFIRRLKDEFEITIGRLDYDRWESKELINELEEELGIICVECGQSYPSLNGPTKTLEQLVASQTFHHPGHIVFDWMAGNLCVAVDPAGNKKPKKDRSLRKIDGMVALIMSLRGYISALDEKGTEESFYQQEMRRILAQREADPPPSNSVKSGLRLL